MKRLLFCVVLSLLAIQLCLAPVMAGSPPPTVTTLPATNVTPNSATLNGSISGLVSQSAGGIVPAVMVSPMGFFRYGTSRGSYTSQTAPVSCGGPFASQFSATVTGLIPGITYYAVAVLAWPSTTDYKIQQNDYLISFLSTGTHGLGTGLGYIPDWKLSNFVVDWTYIYGNEITFTTPGGGTVGGAGQGGTNSGNGGTSTGPVPMANIVVQSASIASS
ncbi:MAG: hypothetical protein JXA01_08560, partial [Dehalococcoidia bacterium]|nr:hypothetical protein [Dehalococcoidia bacterium]